jgi:cytochrome P450
VLFTEHNSTTTVWCLWALCLNPHVQDKLREELQAVSTDAPTMDELNGLPYLDAVLRETCRLYTTIAILGRSATQDDIIPLSEPYVDRNGVKQDHIKYEHPLGYPLCHS